MSTNTQNRSARDSQLRGIRRKKRTSSSFQIQDLSVLFVLVGLIAVVAILEPSFIAPANVIHLLHQWAPLGIMVIATTFVMIAGWADFSIGGTYVVAGVTYALVANHSNVLLGLLAALACGLVIGLANGLLVTKGGVNAFICTIATGQVGIGLGLIITQGAPIMGEANEFKLLGAGKIGGIALSTMIFVLVLVVGGLVLWRTIFGRLVYSVGGNPDACRLNGIAVDRVLGSTFIISGVAAALAGALTTSRLGAGQASSSTFLLALDVFIAIVLGGTAIGGGFGAIWRSAVGLGFLIILQNGFNSLGIDPFAQTLLKGLILVGAVAWVQYLQRRSARKGSGPQPNSTSDMKSSQMQNTEGEEQ